MRLLYRQLTFDLLRTALTTTALTSVVAVILILNGFNEGLVAQLGEYWKVDVEARWFIDIDVQDPIFGGFRNDSFVTVRLATYL